MIMKNWIVLIAVLPFILSCNNKNIGKAESINGIWGSIGSGWVMEIKDSTSYQIYDITSISCLPQSQGNFKEIEQQSHLIGD